MTGLPARSDGLAAAPVAAPVAAPLVVLLAVLLVAGGRPASAQTATRNEFGPLDARCRGACGGDCPDTCERTEFNECSDQGTDILVVERYVCGTHQGCRDHDDCLDACYAPYEYGDIPLTDLTWADAEFWGAGGCQRECHLEAWNYASEQWGGDGPAAVHGWIGGAGPNDGSMVFEYTRATADGPDRTEPCPECQECFRGACLPVEGCEPCNSCKDVHLYTLDGLHYDYQGVGEFTLIENADRSFVVQARQGPYGTQASVNVAVAMQVAGTRVEVGFDGIRIDGAEPLDVPVGETVRLESGGSVRRLKEAWLALWPGGARVSVRVFSRTMDIGMVLPDAMRGTVRGLLGDFDGDPANDLRLDDGTVLERPVAYETLYGPFAAAWRIEQRESLFTYPDGVGTADYQRPGFPERHVRLEDLPGEDVAWARGICREAGVPAGARLDDCVYDVALTGDPSFALRTQSANPEPREILRLVGDPGPPLPLAADVTIDAPREVHAGETIEVALGGTTHPRDRVVVAVERVDGRVRNEIAREVPVRNGAFVPVPAPPDAGSYVLRYLTTPDDRILARRDLTVTVPPVALRAPDTVRAGDVFRVQVEGDTDPMDWIALVHATSGDGRVWSRSRIHQAEAGAATLEAPPDPGAYEVRYVTDVAPSRIRARVAVTVTPRAVSLTAPDRATAGAAIEVRVAGQPRVSDWLVVVPTEAGPDALDQRARVPEGAPAVATLAVPTPPGRYEVRYVTEASPRRVLATSPLNVLPRTVAMDAAATILADGDLEIRIGGDPRASDWVVVVPPDAAPEDIGHHRARVPEVAAGDAPVAATIRVSTVPGTYEVRYVTEAWPMRVLARRALTVEPRRVTLDAAARVPASFPLEVAVGGAPRAQDFLLFVEPGAPDDDVGAWSRVSLHQPGGATVEAPSVPGAYELRYTTAQSPRRVLARRPVTVAPRRIALDAPDAVDAGAALRIAASGQLAIHDLVTIVPAGAPDDATGEDPARVRIPRLDDDDPEARRELELRAPAAPGRYEIRYVGHAVPPTVHARRELAVR